MASQGNSMTAFCDHCQGQRFDRAQVLRALRAARRQLRQSKGHGSADHAITLAIRAVRSLEIPHLEPEDEPTKGEWLH
jgi:imidazolonepropionase-like amidohydrolase